MAGTVVVVVVSASEVVVDSVVVVVVSTSEVVVDCSVVVATVPPANVRLENLEK